MKYRRITGMILICISLFLFALVVTLHNLYSIKADIIIDTYQTSIEQLQKDEIHAMSDQCREYNASLSEDGMLHALSEEKEEEYNKLLNYHGDGVMAVITIPSISVSLPVYHGSDDMTLRKGAGHCNWSSLPTGEKGTHAVITAHSGMAEARMFTDLPLLKCGDVFTVTVLNQDISYIITSIKTVKPEDTSLSYVDPDNASCTLVTCTPYGINYHRLCITGIRAKPSVNTEAHGFTCMHFGIYKIRISKKGMHL